MAKRKKGMTFIPYDYEAAYNKSLEDMNEFFVEQMFKHGKKVVYALKEIRAGDQFEVEIYPQFKKMDEVPPEGRSIKKDNDKAQRNLNDKNARKYVERLINENFTDRDLWLTFTYDNEHLPPDGDIDVAIKNVQKFIRRVNYQRKKRGLPNARYVYVTAYNPTEEIRWHHHIVMDGDMDMDVVEGCWKQSSRNEVRRLQKDENGLTGMAKYIVEEKNRVKSEKRWNSSQGLRDPDIKVVHSKRPTAKAGGYKKIGTYVETMAASIASVIMFACDELHFATGAQAMIHKPLCMAWGNADDFKEVIKQLDLCEDSILDVYEEHMKEGVTRDKIKSFMAKEKWFSGAELAEYFDVEIDDKAAVAACASDYFEKYSHVPENIKGTDTKDIVNAVLAELENRNNAAAEAEKQRIEAEKQDILADLDMYGI